CRCTGYRPIVDAALAACGSRSDTSLLSSSSETAARLAALNDGADIFIGDATTFFAAPASIASLATLYAAHPDATIVSGATDVGLWITKQL
ncbi:xanthine dehydrogenase small subunit, partial [Acinetobacter baumannii]